MPNFYPIGTGLFNGGLMSRAGSLDVAVDSGDGAVIDDATFALKPLAWTAQVVSVPDSAYSYIYIDNDGVAQSALTKPADIPGTILLGSANTLEGIGSITTLFNFPVQSSLAPRYIVEYLREAVGSVYSEGSIITEGGSQRTMDATDGVFWFSSNKFNISVGNGFKFRPVYHVGGVETTGSNENILDNTQYDDGTDLAPLSPGFYVKHVVMLGGDGIEDIRRVIYGRSQYATLLEAQMSVAACPLVDFELVNPIAAVIVQEGNPGIVYIQDIRHIVRPTAAVLPPESPVADHSALSNLLLDSHPQYAFRFATIVGNNVDVSPAIPIDVVPLTDADLVKWFLFVKETATPTNRRAVEILAVNDGASIQNSDQISSVVTGVVAGFVTSVDISGGNMRLLLAATNNVDFVVRRGVLVEAP